MGRYKNSTLKSNLLTHSSQYIDKLPLIIFGGTKAVLVRKINKTNRNAAKRRKRIISLKNCINLSPEMLTNCLLNKYVRSINVSNYNSLAIKMLKLTIIFGV